MGRCGSGDGRAPWSVGRCGSETPWTARGARGVARRVGGGQAPTGCGGFRPGVGGVAVTAVAPSRDPALRPGPCVRPVPGHRRRAGAGEPVPPSSCCRRCFSPTRDPRRGCVGDPPRSAGTILHLPWAVDMSGSSTAGADMSGGSTADRGRGSVARASRHLADARPTAPGGGYPAAAPASSQNVSIRPRITSRLARQKLGSVRSMPNRAARGWASSMPVEDRRSS
jgi:hypothetical protein